MNFYRHSELVEIYSALKEGCWVDEEVIKNLILIGTRIELLGQPTFAKLFITIILILTRFKDLLKSLKKLTDSILITRTYDF